MSFYRIRGLLQIFLMINYSHYCPLQSSQQSSQLTTGLGHLKKMFYNTEITEIILIIVSYCTVCGLYM